MTTEEELNKEAARQRAAEAERQRLLNAEAARQRNAEAERQRLLNEEAARQGREVDRGERDPGA
jgi:hypothetical protein